MPAGPSLPDTINPAETAVLFIDLQKRWTFERDTRVFSVIDQFALQTAQLGAHNYWIAHDIGWACHLPQPVTPDLIDMLDRLPEDDRFLVDLRQHRGHVMDKYEPGAFTNPHLIEHLRWSGIKRVYGCGYVASQCVASTLLGARAAGFAVGMLADLSVDNRPNGMLAAKGRKWMRSYKLPRLRRQPFLQALESGAKRPVVDFSLAKQHADGLTP